MDELDEIKNGNLTLHNEASLLSLISNPYIKAATSENTRKAYQSDIRHFERWGGVLPANPESISAYLQFYASKLNPRTLARRLTAIKNWHQYQGFNDPTNHPAIQKTMIGITRVHAKPKEKAPALSPQDLLRIVLKLKEEGTLKALRDSALLQIGYFGSFRRSELVSIRYENINWKEEGIEILLPHSKTDQLNEGQTVAVPYGNETLCPVRTVKEWCEIANIKNGFIFCSIKKGNTISDEALSQLSVNHILKSSAEKAGLNNFDKLSSHSLRRGFTTSAYLAGGDIATLMRQCRWKKADTCLGYIEETKNFNENPGSKIFKTIKLL